MPSSSFFESSRPTTPSATSSALSMRGPDQMIAESASCGRSRVMSVSAPSGQTTCMSIGTPAAISSPCSEAVKPSTACLLAAYTARPGTGVSADIDPRLITCMFWPPFCLIALYGGARAPDHSEHVDLGDQANLVVGLVPDLARAQDARVVDPDLERPALGGGARGAAVRLGVAHVDLHREATHLLRGGGGRLGVDVGGEHRVAAAASRFAIARPKPRPAPVTTAAPEPSGGVAASERAGGCGKRALDAAMALALPRERAHVAVEVDLDRVPRRGDVALAQRLVLALDRRAHPIGSGSAALP